MNLDHLYFDIVSDLELRISDFASLGIFTLVKNPLQINLFMQNKPNFQKSQTNLNSLLTTDYENKRNWTLGESKPNSNPIKPNLKRAKMNINLTLTKDYRKNDCLASQKTNPIQTQPKRVFPLTLKLKNL